MFKICDKCNLAEIDEIIPTMIYYYLFDGLSLNDIEYKIFNTYEFKGWISKSFLNFYGISTERGTNSGMYNGRSISEVVEELSQSTNLYHIRVAKILKDKYL